MRLAYRGADQDLSRAPQTTQRLARFISSRFPDVAIGSSYRPKDVYRDHREGALDIMTEDKTMHDAICTGLIDIHNQGLCQIVSLISWRHRWTPEHGWHPYRGQHPHTDHVHAWLLSSAGFRVPPEELSISRIQDPTPEPYPLAGQTRGGVQCYYGHYRGPANWVGGRRPEDRIGIRRIQARLRQLGHDVTVDGVYGDITERSVRHFQSAHRLPVDGLVGASTWTRLMT